MPIIPADGASGGVLSFDAGPRAYRSGSWTGRNGPVTAVPLSDPRRDSADVWQKRAGVYGVTTSSGYPLSARGL